MGRQTLALLAALNAACHSVVELGQAAAELFQTHPDYTIITSFRASPIPPARVFWPKSVMTGRGSPMLKR